MNRYFSLLMAVFASLGIASAAAQDAPRNVDELLHKSGLWKQVAEFEPSMQQGLDESRKEQKAGAGGAPPLSDADYARLKRATAAAYAPDRLRQEFRGYIARDLSREDEREVLRWLDSDLGKRITRIEEEASTLEEVLKREKISPGALASVPSARKQRFEKLIKATRMGELSAGLMINTTLGVAYGFAYATPNADFAALEKLKRQLESQKPELAELLGKRSLADIAVIYRALSDAELDRYLVFMETEAGQHYHEVTSAALDAVLSRASVNIGTELAAMQPGRERKS
jgi:hypothetical protein